MKLKKAVFWSSGIICATGLLLGILLFAFGKYASLPTAITLICLSICFGILFPNPICFWGLIVGILMLVIPPQIAGGIIALVSVGGLITNYIFGKKKLQKAYPFEKSPLTM